MTTIWDLAYLDGLPRGVRPSEMDPFTESDALLESQVLSVHLDAMRSRVAVLLEFRTAFHFRDESNTAVLWADGSSDVTWRAEGQLHRRFAWGIDASSSWESSHRLGIHLQCFRAAEFTALARNWWFAVGTVPGLGRIPDYTDATDEHVVAQTAQWSSELVIECGSSWSGPAG